MTITSYLMFNGEAEAAANFYAEALGGKIENLYRYADFPPMEGAVPLSDEYRQRVGHCCLSLPGGATIGIADTVLGDTLTFGSGHMITVGCESAESAETVWNRMRAGARNIACPLQKTFFAARYGEMTDRFGVMWAVMYEEK